MIRKSIEAALSGGHAPPRSALSAAMSRRDFSKLLGLGSVVTLAGCGGGDDDGPAGTLALDAAAKSTNPDTYPAYEWYRWTFPIDPALDTVGARDGTGQMYVRLFTPKTTSGTLYPLVAALGGLGNDGNFTTNSYARTGSNLWANDAFQARYPAYVVSVALPWEACVSYEAEMVYMFQIGELIKAINNRFGNVDMSRIYATGTSQGAGWSYEAAAAQPDLFAGLFINSGTAVHTTWGDTINLAKLKDVNLFIAHGSRDTFIPPNEAYRVYNELKALGKTNLKLDVITAGHGLGGTDYATTAPLTEVRSWQDWLFTQKKGVVSAGPMLTEVQPYSNYLWAGRFALADIPTWATDVPYAAWVEPHDNPTWTQIKTTLALPTVAGTSSGGLVIGRFRIGDETQTTYDSANTAATGLVKGQSLCMTIQGYTGPYGDDLAAFNSQWDVDWAVMDGQVIDIRITTAASPAPIARPSTVNLTNGGGPNVNNSLATANVLDGSQVYLKIALADAYTSGRLKLYVRFTRKLGTLPRGTEFASYWHVVNLAVNQA